MTAATPDLDEALGYPINVDEPAPAPPDAETVNRMLRTRARLQREATEIDRVAGAEIEAIGAWRDDRLQGIGRAIDWLDRSLEQWTRTVAPTWGKRKSLSLPHGVVRLRAAHRKIEAPATLDEPTALALIEALGEDAVRLKREPAKKVIADGVVAHERLSVDDDGLEVWSAKTTDGTVLPDTIRLWIPTRDTFSVDTDA